ncbi:MAG TPA: hypothetical protein VEW66_02275, partial [Thermomicrobiales bacterium]|nr:hypothetical protein [Thermomicrobiales bacterium]
MAAHLRRREFLAGGAAAAMLLVNVTLGLTPWLAIALATATYVGIIWLRPRSEDDATVDEAYRQRLAYVAAVANAAAIRALQPQIARPATR